MISWKGLGNIMKNKLFNSWMSTWKIRAEKDHTVLQYLNPQSWKGGSNHKNFSDRNWVVYNHSLRHTRIFLSNFAWNHTHCEWQTLLSFNKQTLLCNHSVWSPQAISTRYRNMQSLWNSSVGHVSYGQSCSKTTEADKFYRVWYETGKLAMHRHKSK